MTETIFLRLFLLCLRDRGRREIEIICAIYIIRNALMLLGSQTVENFKHLYSMLKISINGFDIYWYTIYWIRYVSVVLMLLWPTTPEERT